jgi:ubiquinone/menaquinone biosynthesis C-methylase UbiE
MTSFHEHSYSQHHCQLNSGALQSADQFRAYEQSIDAWRHHRMMEPFRCFSDQTSWKWLTIGDGSGFDAARLLKMGVNDVTASDLSTARLALAAEQGLITRYCAQNAERMSTRDGEFNVVYCKEAFHHFPRPWIGLYEMLRTASDVVLLTEPRDWIIDRGKIQLIGPRGIAQKLWLWLVHKFLGRMPLVDPEHRYTLGENTPRYEDAGNFVFSASAREIEKVALGLDLPAVAFFGMDDEFQPGLHDSPADPENPKFARLSQRLSVSERRAAAGVGSTGLLLAAIFIRLPPQHLMDSLRECGWYVRLLPRNPHAGRSA